MVSVEQYCVERLPRSGRVQGGLSQVSVEQYCVESRFLHLVIQHNPLVSVEQYCVEMCLEYLVGVLFEKLVSVEQYCVEIVIQHSLSIAAVLRFRRTVLCGNSGR